ncbi:MAG: permease [Mesorhizobium amorphae]|nr:MAG: permease [Mesorhizobium amorphae]
MRGNGFLAAHELRLIWREATAVLFAGSRRRRRMALVIATGLAVGMHLIAWRLAVPYASVAFPPDRATLLTISGSALLAWTVMIAQAMESVTRAFYARADLDLLLSSPAPVRTVFGLRVGAIGVSTSLLALLLMGPFINMLALEGGPHWLAAYGVLFAMALTATALAVGLTVCLFALIGPKRTRFVSQVVAAIVGASFVIGVQAFAVFAYGTLSRFDVFVGQTVLDWMPPVDSLAWFPARAAIGDGEAFAAVAIFSVALFALAVSIASRRFGNYALAAASLDRGSRRQARRAFRPASPAATLRRKEWTLLARDPWLVSQTLMQLLYLIPPALLLWRNYGDAAGGVAILAPVLVMAAGQLAGGLAWLAVSGEDAPDLVATAPVTPRAVLRAKIEAIIGAVALLMLPILLPLAFTAPGTALVALAGVLASAGAATAIQVFFRAQAKRSQLRRRQTSSRFATFAEAFSSIGWAATAGFAAAGSPVWVATAALALAVLMLAWMLSPRGSGGGVAVRA